MYGDSAIKVGVLLRGLGASVLLCLVSACASAPPSSSPFAPASQAPSAEMQTASMAPRKDKGDGIGGTGLRPNPHGDGIGGTGIVGTISGFGSILVNGLKLEFNHSTTVESDGKPTALDELRVGQVIQGVAHTVDGKLHLERLEIQHAVSGPISTIDYATETMTVLGQKVKLNLGGDAAAVEAFKTLQKGDMVSISGLRQADGTVVATRVDQRRNDGRIVVRGDVTSVTATSVRIGDLDIPMGTATIMTLPQTGGRVYASGRMINGQFVADVIGGLPVQPFGADVTDVSLEGYAPPAGQPLKLNGMTVDGASLPAGVTPNDRIVVMGHVDVNGHVDATSITKGRTVVSLLQARGSKRPMWERVERPERVRPPERPERPEQAVKPEKPERPVIERPTATS